MRKLTRPISINETEHRKPLVKLAPLLEEGGIIKVKETPKPAVKQETKRESKVPKKKGLTTQQYAAILSFVMMLTALVSQAATIIGCAKSTVEQQKNTMPVVTITESAAPGDAQSNVSAPMISPKPPDQAIIKPVVNPNSRSNYSLP
jgi:hypothetical protein